MAAEKIVVGTKSDYVEFEHTKTDLLHYPSLTFAVTASAHGFTGHRDGVRFTVVALTDFITQMTNLERTRQGEAKLRHDADPSPYCPCHFRIFSTDQLGNLAVEIELLRFKLLGNNPHTYVSKVSVTFGLNMDVFNFPDVLAAFKSLETFWQSPQT